MSRGRRVGNVLRGLASLITLIVLVVGLPLALYRLGGSPIPHRILGWHQIERVLLHRDNGSIFFGAVRDVSWIAWAAFTVAVLAEVQAAVRGRSAPRLGLGGLQAAAGRLVALTMLTFSGPATALLSLPQAVPVAAVAVQPAATAPISPDATVAAHDATVAPHDATWASHDAAVASPDGAWESPDGAWVSPDGAWESPDGAWVSPDGAWTSPEAAVASFDTVWSPPDAAVASPDAAVASLDAVPLPSPDVAWASPDAAWAPHGLAVVRSAPESPGQAAADQAASSSASETPGRPAADQAAVQPDPQVMSMGFYQVVTVRPGDCLWTIAQRYLGDGDLYPEIVKINLGHDMGGGQVFTDPAMIWPGWMLQLPAAGPAGPSAPAPAATHHHDAHPSREPRFRRPHAAASAGTSHAASASAMSHPAATTTTSHPAAARASSHPAAAGASSHPASTGAQPASTPAPAVRSAEPAVSGPPAARQSPNGISGAAGLPAAASPAPGQTEQIPPLAVFAAGMLAGGAVVTLAGLRHRQRQYRRPGRRIPLPVSAPVMEAEQRLRAQPVLEPATALRAALSDLGAGLIASGQQIPDITGIRLLPSGMELLLASPASEPPPPPFTVPGGRQGMAWHLSLPVHAPTAPFPPTDTGDLLPGLFTVGVADAGYLLLDLEYLQVTAVDGPAALADQFLATAAAELATSELAGWYDLILVGCPELETVGGRATVCESLEEALDLVAAKAVALRRRLSGEASADIRQHRLADPGDEDWALALLVSRIPPTSGQLALLLDLASDPAGIAALVPGTTAVPQGHAAPARIELAEDHRQPGGMVARISPLHLQAWPQPLSDMDYLSLASLFAIAAQEGDVAADAPPYDGSSWPPPRLLAAAAEMAGDGLDAGLEMAGDGLDAGPEMGEPAPDSLGVSLGIPDPPAEQTSLRVGVLGTLTINGAPGALLPAQSQLVLALALHGQDGLSNQQLCYLLGADPDHPKPSDSLRQLIVRTRRQLGRAPDGREWIEHLGAGQYALHPDARFDWHEFDALTKEGMHARDADCLREALRLIRGQPFSGCYHWSLDLATIETVRAQIVDAAEMLAGLELAAGDCAASARAARTGLAGDSGAEQLWRALMRAEHAAGNMSGVREAWSRCLDTITEIAADGEPHPETSTLYRQLLESSSTRPAWSPN